jgi:hypothetical protein
MVLCQPPHDRATILGELHYFAGDDFLRRAAGFVSKT